jgi:hypothetical protein
MRDRCVRGCLEMARIQKSDGKEGEHFKRVLMSVSARVRKKIQHPIENAF